MVFWLHIGFHKTGTTFLQNYLREQAGWLISQGCLYPEAGERPPRFPTHDKATRGHGALATALRQPDGPHARKLLKALNEEIDHSKATNVLLSSELFSAPKFQDAIEGAIRALGNERDTKVIVYLRRQDLWIESLYKEILGWSAIRETRDIVTFIREEGAAWMDYERRLEPWIACLGHENVVVRSYDDLSASPGIVSDFLTQIGISAQQPKASAEMKGTNPSIDASLVDFLRAVNTLEGLDRSAKSRITRILMDPGNFPSPTRASLLDDDKWRSIRESYADMNRRLADGLMTGPSANFLFPDDPPERTLAKQGLPFEAAQELFQAISRTKEDANEAPRSSSRDEPSIAKRISNLVHRAVR